MIKVLQIDIKVGNIVFFSGTIILKRGNIFFEVSGGKLGEDENQLIDLIWDDERYWKDAG